MQPVTPLTQGTLLSITRPHVIPIRIIITTASRRLMGCIRNFFPACIFCRVGMRLMTKATGKSNMLPIRTTKPNVFGLEPSVVSIGVMNLRNGSISSAIIRKRIVIGRARKKLMIAADLGLIVLDFVTIVLSYDN